MLGTGKDHVFARVSSNKYGIGDVLKRERLDLSIGRVQLKAKPKGRGPTLEETRTDHAIRSSVAVTKLPLRHEILKEGEMRCFENIFFLDFLTFWLSYSTYSIITGS